jgi:hypothetical protein
MCQLTLLNLRDEALNRIFLPPLLQLNSIGNEDGTGFLTMDNNSMSLYKSKESASDLEELGLDVRERVTSDYPIIAHVRAASKGIVVKEENAHPFQGSRFTLAHNGRLYPKDEVVSWNSTTDDTGLPSDSLVFLNSLENEAKKNPGKTFLEIIQQTMLLYKGKFALLIYDELEDTHYVCRGSTADLHILPMFTAPIEGGDLTQIGFVVNTKKSSLSDASQVACQIAQAVTGLRLICGKIEELDKNSVYEVDGIELKKLGELKENPVNFTYQNQNSFGGTWKGAGSTINLELPIWKLSDRIQKFMTSHFLTIGDIDAIFSLFLGVGMADIQLSDLQLFVDKVIPKISMNKKIREKMSKLMGSHIYIYQNIYKKVDGLVYPWMLSDSKGIDNLYKYVKEWNKK